MASKIAFIDRDGVINKEVGYLHKISEFVFTEKCVEALKIISSLGYGLAIVTNQAGIARGYYTEEDYNHLTSWYVDQLRVEGVEILEVAHCPHHTKGVIPELAIECNCRKPNPGMLLDIALKFKATLSDSLIIGDKFSDVEAGERAGLGRTILVESGHKLSADAYEKYEVYKDLYDAALNL